MSGHNFFDYRPRGGGLGTHDDHAKRAQVCGSVDTTLAICVRMLRQYHAPQAAAYVARARKSVQGAERHARRLASEATT